MNDSPATEHDYWNSLDRDCLLLAIEQSLRVRTPPHFYSWTQGALQSLVPHELLFCATFDAHGQTLASDVLCPAPLTDAARAAITGPDGSLLVQLLGYWERSGRVPVMVDPRAAQAALAPGVVALMSTCGLGNVCAHGACGPTGSVDSFFGFTGITRPLDTRLADVIELILPHLRAALIRARPRKRSADGALRRRALTARETDILRLLQQGRSNAEIGIALMISPLTVKNHVQKVLRKLGVRNRTQAAALEINLQRERDG